MLNKRRVSGGLRYVAQLTGDADCNLFTTHNQRLVPSTSSFVNSENCLSLSIDMSRADRSLLPTSQHSVLTFLSVQTSSEPTGCRGYVHGDEVGVEVHYSFTSRNEVKNEWSYPSTPPICLRSLPRDKFTLYLFARIHSD